MARAHPQQPQRHWRADGVDVVYVPRLTSRPLAGGSAMDGNILRRTTAMGEPQQVHSSWGRAAGGVGGAAGCLNTNNFNSTGTQGQVSRFPHFHEKFGSRASRGSSLEFRASRGSSLNTVRLTVRAEPVEACSHCHDPTTGSGRTEGWLLNEQYWVKSQYCSLKNKIRSG